MIRVSYDAQIFRRQRRGGISRYFAELMRAFIVEPSLGVQPVFRSHLVASRHLREAGLGHHWVVHPRILGYAESTLMSSQRTHRGADIIHHTYYSPRGLERSWSTPRVTTIHDMIPELMPQFFPMGNPHLAKREYVAQSGGLIFVSETSRRDLFRLYGPQDIPTAVAHLAPGQQFYPRPSVSTRGSQFVLFVGHRGGYKEFGTLLNALYRVRSNALMLCAVGGGPFNDEEVTHIRKLGLVARVRQESADDETLATLYSSALALVVPSVYEGFGLPVVEAMASGCPVVLSDTDVFREIAADVAQFFPTYDIDALADALNRISEDAEMRQSNGQRGLVRARDFTWERTAQATADLYREVLQNN